MRDSVSYLFGGPPAPCACPRVPKPPMDDGDTPYLASFLAKIATVWQQSAKPGKPVPPRKELGPSVVARARRTCAGRMSCL